MRLTTARLTLRPFQPEDAQGLRALLGDPDVALGMEREPCAEGDLPREAKRRAKEESFAAVCLADTGRLIGEARLLPEAQGCYAVSVALERGEWGRGYATEALACLMQYAFTGLDAHRVTARVDPANRRALRLLRRLRMRKEGRLVRGAYFRTEPETGAPLWHDVCLYATLREEWLKR